MDKFVIPFVLLAASVLCTLTWAADSCASDTDCPGGCCIETKTGKVCEKLGKMGDICDLEGMGLAKDKCGCEQGMSCVKLDLSDWGPTVAAVNPIFEKFHYGICDVQTAPVG
ncbi:uncharacterized protein LOC106011609 [Aplysia californica]|uniref:Uncharacterized protein LOC106011609 n=1 Tax=Aplysia californica TaxID=6500 RepID=A0ABM0ZYP1_APLCA|nr:uncharacterized protein LOC106011609 [Aplysia californica]